MEAGASGTSSDVYEARARLLLADEGEKGRAPVLQSLATLGLAAPPPVPLADAGRRLKEQVATGGVIVRLGNSPEVLPELWPVLREAADYGRHHSLVAAPKALRPAIESLPRPAGLLLLYEPSALDWLTALSTSFEPMPHRLHDVSCHQAGG